MLFVFVRSRCTYGFTHERVCNCLYRSHSMLFVLVWSRVKCVFLINECVIVYTGVILCCSCSLGAVVNVFLLMNECVNVYTGVILCCSCSLGAVVHMVLLMNECVIVYTGVIICCSCTLGAVLNVFSS